MKNNWLCFTFSHSIQSTIWSLIDHFNRLVNENSLNINLILQIYLQLKFYEVQPTYEQIIEIASAFADMHIRIIENNENNLFDNLILWRDALMNFIHFNNHDFHLFTIISLIDFIIPKLSVKLLKIFVFFLFKIKRFISFIAF